MSDRNERYVLCAATAGGLSVEMVWFPDSWDDPEMRAYERTPARIGFNAMYLGDIEPVVIRMARALHANVVGEERELYYTFADDWLITDPEGTGGR